MLDQWKVTAFTNGTEADGVEHVPRKAFLIREYRTPVLRLNANWHDQGYSSPMILYYRLILVK